MSGEYKERDCAEQQALFLDYCVGFVRKECLLPFKSTFFLYMYNDFEINYDCSGEGYKIIIDSYMQYSVKKIE